MAKVETVRGPIHPSRLGITLPHEHVLIDFSFRFKMPTEASRMKIVNAPVTIENLGVLHRGGMFQCKDNLVIADEALAAEELREFKARGGRSVVDLSVPGIGRDPLALRRVAENANVNIIAATGWYVAASHGTHVKKMTVSQLSETMVKELTEGIGDTGIRAGLIKCACSEPIPHHPHEKRVIQAAARAQNETGACLTVHPSLYDTPRKSVGPKVGEAYLDIIEKEGGDLSKFYLSHADFTSHDLKYQKKLLERGITLSYDTFSGIQAYFDDLYIGARPPTEEESMKVITELCRQGYDRQIVLSQDVFLKMYLKRYGGNGYTYLLDIIVPTLKHTGVSNKQLRNMLIENPKQLLSRR